MGCAPLGAGVKQQLDVAGGATLEHLERAAHGDAALAGHEDELAQEGVEELWPHVRGRAEGEDHPRDDPLAHLSHAQLVAAQPHVPVAFVAVGVDDGAVAVDVLVHEGQRIEHAPHQRLEPRGVRRYAKGAADRVVRLHDLRVRAGARAGAGRCGRRR